MSKAIEELEKLLEVQGRACEEALHSEGEAGVAYVSGILYGVYLAIEVLRQIEEE